MWMMMQVLELEEITAADGTIIPLQAYLIAVVILLTQLELKDI
jgi:hypothetical protein